MKLTTMKKWFSQYGWLVILIIIFMLGVGCIVWIGNVTTTSGISPSPKIDPIIIEYNENENEQFSPGFDLSILNTKSPSPESPSPEVQKDLDEDLETSNNDEEMCPTLLIKRGNKVMLFNKNMPETPGENPIFFDNLDQYTKDSPAFR